MTIQLLVRADCHLCEDATALLSEIGADFLSVDVDADPELRARYGDAVPVLLAGEREIARAPLDGETLRRVLGGADVRSVR